MENINTFENFNDVVEIDFPVKNHSSAARRKKAFFKGKKRYDMVRQKNCLPSNKKDTVLRGMMRKTCVVDDGKDWVIIHGFRDNRGTVRRQWSANDKMNEYVMED